MHEDLLDRMDKQSQVTIDSERGGLNGDWSQITNLKKKKANATTNK